MSFVQPQTVEIVEACLAKSSYLAGDEVRLLLRCSPQSEIRFAQVTNISVDIHRIEIARNQFAFGFGANPNSSGDVQEVRQTIPREFSPGFYLIAGATFCWETTSGQPTQERVRFRPICFAVQTILERPFTAQQVLTAVDNLMVERRSYVEHEIQTDQVRQSKVGGKQFVVHVFGVGCLIHAHQQLQGCSIIPLNMGLSHKRMLEIVNISLARLGIDELPFSAEFEEQFQRSTPTVLVSYDTVCATDHDDAMRHCSAHANQIFSLLGLDRGQKPREFACFATEYGTTQRWHYFHQPWYRGNLVSDFNPVAVANLIERCLPKLQAQPFLRLLVSTFADATSEENQGFALLRYWAVMELMADRHVHGEFAVTHPNGVPILKPSGKPEHTGAKVARVYQYILDSGAFVETISHTQNGIQLQCIIGGDATQPGYTTETELLPLWDMVKAAYVVRNAVAHEGQFDLDKAALGDPYEQLAGRLIRRSVGDPREFIRRQAHLSVMKELTAP